MAALKCVRCRQLLGPDEPIVVVTVGRLRWWATTVGQRLNQAPGRWHYRCAPMPIRRYAAVVDDAPEPPYRDEPNEDFYL